MSLTEESAFKGPDFKSPNPLLALNTRQNTFVTTYVRQQSGILITWSSNAL